jgi:hypothetical protein
MASQLAKAPPPCSSWVSLAPPPQARDALVEAAVVLWAHVGRLGACETAAVSQQLASLLANPATAARLLRPHFRLARALQAILLDFPAGRPGVMYSMVVSCV